MRISGILVLLCLVMAAPAYAAGQLADVQVYDRNSGVILGTYVHNGRYYVSGEPGHEYQIRITNTSGQRLLAVASVDGVNVISGETASPGQSGYVMSSNYNEVLDIAGWRKSMNRIASFYFTRLKNSYAARTGRPGNVGVIGVALFRERQYLPPPPAPCCWPYGSSSDYPRDSSREEGMAEQDRAAPAAKSAAPASEAAGSVAAQAPRRQDFRRKEESIGTGHGRSQESVVTYTSFERASDSPDEVVAIYYDSYKNLVAQGVIPTAYSDNRRPDPFPNVFTPDP